MCPWLLPLKAFEEEGRGSPVFSTSGSLNPACCSGVGGGQAPRGAGNLEKSELTEGAGGDGNG